MNLLTSKQAATLIGIADTTLKNSRVTGVLLGIPRPDYLKLGNSVRYREQDLQEWLASLDNYKVHSEG